MTVQCGMCPHHVSVPAFSNLPDVNFLNESDLSPFFRRQDLQRDVPAELLITGEIDFAHPAGADFFDDFVMEKCASDHRSILTLRTLAMDRTAEYSPDFPQRRMPQLETMRPGRG